MSMIKQETVGVGADTTGAGNVVHVNFGAGRGAPPSIHQTAGIMAQLAADPRLAVRPATASQQEIDAWNERLDDTSPFTADLFELASLLRAAPVGVDPFALGLLRGVYETRIAQADPAEAARLADSGIDVERVAERQTARVDRIEGADGEVEDEDRGYLEGARGIQARQSVARP